MGGLTAANLQQPSFFGNTALLSNSAMAAMNNRTYALESQIRDNQSEIKAFIQAGKANEFSTQLYAFSTHSFTLSAHTTSRVVSRGFWLCRL